MKTGDLFRIADERMANVRACYTGEFRPPKKGEMFLSGAIVEGYVAYADMDTPYHIARIVRVRMVEVIDE